MCVRVRGGAAVIKRETDYAIRSVLCLARCQIDTGAVAVSTAALADQTGVPYRFLRKIVLKLTASGIIKSRRGKGGGLSLACAPQEITLLQLLQVTEPESVILNQCLDAGRTPCVRKAYCGLYGALGQIQTALRGQLAGITLLHLATEESHALTEA